MTDWLNVILQGVLVGGLYAMFAAGLSLIFGVMRLVNIAHGDLIVLAAYLALVVTQSLGINPLLALVVVVPLMALIGYGLQRFILNRTLARRLLPPLLVTFGLSIIIQNGLLELFTADSRQAAGRIDRGRQHPARQPRHRHAAAHPVHRRRAGDRRPAVRVLSHRARPCVPRHVGRSGGGAAGRPRQCPHLRLAMAVSLAVVAVAGVFLAVRANFDPAIGPARLIFGFEAVIMGGLGSMWGTLAGGIILGVAQAIGARSIPAGSCSPAHRVPDRPGGAARGAVSQGAGMSAPSVQVAHATRAEPRRRRRGRSAIRRSGRGAVLGGRQELRLLAEIYAYVALASLWNLLAGYAGLVSVGQQAYVGLGAYVLFALTMLMGIHPLLAIVVAGVAGAVLSAPVAALIFRLRGHYFAIGTWVVAEVFRLSAAQMSALGGGSGISLPSASSRRSASSRQEREFIIYWIALAIVVAVLAAIFALLRSRYGLALTALRDNELAARSNGVDVTRLKLALYVATAFGTATVGALIFLQKLRVSPTPPSASTTGPPSSSSSP
jgi:ABC-type branched-subunit amino acid transport system permease subunit